MSRGLATSLMQVPTARHLLDQMLEDLQRGHSVLGLLPEGVNPSLLRSALRDGLEHWHLHTRDVSISQLDPQAPAASLGQALGVVWGASDTPRTVANLLEQANLPEIIFLGGFDELDEDGRDQWLEFVKQWAQACQSRQTTGEAGPALCLLAQASKLPAPPSSTNMYLSIRVWRGIPTTLEMRLLCRLASEQDSAPLNRWKEHTIPAIAGSDFGLGDYLWAEEYRTGSQLADLLRRFAEKERGWNQDELEAWSVHNHNLPRDRIAWLESWPLRPDLYRAWARGMVHWTPEYGLECHSAVLALLNRREALDHRLWRGQAGFLLPQIDETRLTLCEHLNRYHGQDWPYKWEEPREDRERTEVRATSFACQWGHLKTLLWSQRHRNLAGEQKWRDLVNCSWEIRTQLAHYRPIALKDYEKFCRELEQLHSISYDGFVIG